MSRSKRETGKQSHEDMLLVQSIQITDKFGFEKQQANKNPKTSSTSETVFYVPEASGLCVNGLGEWRRR